jgi:phosphoesterase RecJ-like protein
VTRAPAAQRSLDDAIRDALALLREARRVAIVSHRDPDGDTIGSAIALGIPLGVSGTEVTYHCADPVPEAFRFLPTTAQFSRDPPAGDGLVVTVDFGDAARAKFDLPGGVRVLNIDHHATNAGFGAVNVVDVSSPATAELISRIIDAAGWPWTAEMATAALLGIMTDTGSFQFPSTSPACLERAARLLQDGADLAAIVQNALRTRPFATLKLFGLAFTRLEQELDGRLVHTWIVDSDRGRLGARPEDASGLVEQIARSKGMRVAVLFNAERDTVKVSIRTSAEPPAVDASRLAARFGGGGHVRAAGVLMAGSLDDVREQVLAAAREALR